MVPGKKMRWPKQLAKNKKAKAAGGEADGLYQRECLLEKHAERSPTRTSTKTSTPAGFFAVYIGDERQRFVVPITYLSHPLFKILLEKACDEFGFQQRNGLIVPCTASTFQEVIDGVECNHGNFDLSSVLYEL